jgi:hypothetical protein
VSVGEKPLRNATLPNLTDTFVIAIAQSNQKIPRALAQAIALEKLCNCVLEG